VEGFGSLDGERASFSPGASWVDLARARYPGTYSADIRTQQAEAMAILSLARAFSPESADVAVDLIA
jgi:hypothetical protein